MVELLRFLRRTLIVMGSVLAVLGIGYLLWWLIPEIPKPENNPVPAIKRGARNVYNFIFNTPAPRSFNFVYVATYNERGESVDARVVYYRHPNGAELEVKTVAGRAQLVRLEPDVQYMFRATTDEIHWSEPKPVIKLADSNPTKIDLIIRGE